MSWVEDMMAQGATPNGVTPQVSYNGAAPVPDQKNGAMGDVARVLKDYVQEKQADQERQQKKMSSMADMYKTLRESGYAPDKAHAAVQAHHFPTDPGGISIEEKSKEADITYKGAETRRADAGAVKDLAAADRSKKYEGVMAAAQALKEAQTKKIQAQTDALSSPTAKQAFDNIVTKLSRGEELSDNEKEVLKVMGKKTSGEEIDPFATDTKPAEKTKTSVNTNKDVVMMTAPDGTKVPVHKSKIPQALARGLKM